MFWIKKLVVLLISPLAVGLLVVAAGLFLVWRNHAERWGRRLVVVGLLGLTFASCGPTGELLLRPLEYQYAPVVDAGTLDDPSRVVVLGGGFYHREHGPVTSELTASSTARLMEGIRLYRALEDAKLVVSGAGIVRSGSTAESMASVARETGVPDEDLVVADTPRDTASEAGVVAEMTGEDGHVALVTSASHMPRAMMLFDRRGVDARPAPTHHLTTETPFRLSNLWPTARNVRRVERAVYEYVAIAWVWLGGS